MNVFREASREGDGMGVVGEIHEGFVILFCSVASSPCPPPPLPPKKYPPNLKNGHRGAKFPFSECQNYTDKSISQIPPGGSKLGGSKSTILVGGGVAGVPGQNQQTLGWRSSAWRK